MNDDILIIRKSDKWLKAKITIVFVCSWTLYFFLRYLVKSVINYDEEIENIFLLGLLIAVIIISILIPLYIFLKHKYEFYEIHNDELIIHERIIFTVDRSYSYNQIESIEAVQNYIGKIFDFGTVILSSNTSEPTIKLLEISNPDSVLHLIREKTNLIRQINNTAKDNSPTLMDL